MPSDDEAASRTTLIKTRERPLEGRWWPWGAKPHEEPMAQSLPEAAEQRLLSEARRRPHEKCPPGVGGVYCNFTTKEIPALKYQPDVYSGLELQPLDLSGWSPNYTVYEKAVQLTRPRLAVEVGVWKGRSATYIAHAMMNVTGGGLLLCVDTWLGALEFWTLRFSGGYQDPTRDLALRNGYPQIYYTFLSNVVQSNLKEVIQPLPMTSRTAAELLENL
ncbi:hypothetical protein CYMTET_33498, partial [Cymbomonas tetramitiformis]